MPLLAAGLFSLASFLLGIVVCALWVLRTAHDNLAGVYRMDYVDVETVRLTPDG